MFHCIRVECTLNISDLHYNSKENSIDFIGRIIVETVYLVCIILPKISGLLCWIRSWHVVVILFNLSIRYTAGQINYGGRVTDDWDRRCLMNIINGFYDVKVLDEGFKFDNSGTYYQLSSESKLDVYFKYIRQLPINDTPEIFGLHENANITFAQNETFTVNFIYL